MLLPRILTTLATASVAAASYAGNLNYRSPSHNHPSLGVSIHKVNKRNVAARAYDPTQLNFTHGVASGDPYSDSVILWTRCAPSEDSVKDNSTVSGTVPLFNPVPIYKGDGSHIDASKAPVCLQYTVATDQDLKQVVNSGTVYTSSDVDYTVKVEASNLKGYTSYYYQFCVCDSDRKSPLGRTKTAPAGDDTTDSVRLAVYSCSNFPFGYFNAYGNPVHKNSVDYVLHLGDYIYEYKNGDYGDGTAINRVPLPNNEIFTLYDYRKRHATYKTDKGLLASHQNFPWIPVWDDHEVSDNTYRDGASHLNNTEESFVEDGGVSVDQRKMNAVRAYFEWMPIRQVEMDDNLRIWRSFKIGNLLDIVMLDTRDYDRSITDLYWNTEYIKEISNDAGRSMMGSRQENWFYNQLISSQARGAAWRVIGSQTVFSRLNQSIARGNDLPLDYDAWDGYLSNKNRTLQTLYSHNISNTIMIAGDSHANWVSDLVWLDEKPYDSATGAGAIGVEFAGTAVTSPSPAGANVSIDVANFASKSLVDANDELQWSETYYRGYFELEITKAEMVAKYYGMPNITYSNGEEVSLANFTVKSGENKLSRENGGVGGGVVSNGWVRGGKIEKGLVNDTETGAWSTLPPGQN